MRMSTPQRPIREAMFELLPVELHDVRAAASMLGVARLARSIPYRGCLPMIPAFLAQIRGHIGVAVQAEAVLSCLVKHFVTLGAFTLEARVLRHEVTGHYQRLGPRRPGTPRLPHTWRGGQHDQFKGCADHTQSSTHRRYMCTAKARARGNTAKTGTDVGAPSSPPACS
jgi:hypothetical protein